MINKLHYSNELQCVILFYKSVTNYIAKETVRLYHYHFNIRKVFRDYQIVENHWIRAIAESRKSSAD